MRDIEGSEEAIVKIQAIRYHSINFDEEMRIVLLKLCYNRVEHAQKKQRSQFSLCRLLQITMEKNLIDRRSLDRKSKKPKISYNGEMCNFNANQASKLLEIKLLKL